MCVKCIKHSFKQKKKEKEKRLHISDHIMNSSMSLGLVSVLSLPVLCPVAPFAGF